MTRLIPLVLLLAACTAQPSAPDPGTPGLIGQGRVGAPYGVSSAPDLPPGRRSDGPARRTTPSPAVANVATSEGPSPAPVAGTDAGMSDIDLHGAGDEPAATRFTGTATWYCGPGSRCTRGYGPDDLVAAIDRKDTTFRKGDRVTVRFGDKAVTVTIVDVCACADRRVIDLTSGAFSRLAPLGMGVLSVTVELAGAAPTLPATDVEP